MLTWKSERQLIEEIEQCTRLLSYELISFDSVLRERDELERQLRELRHIISGGKTSAP